MRWRRVGTTGATSTARWWRARRRVWVWEWSWRGIVYAGRGRPFACRPLAVLGHADNSTTSQSQSALDFFMPTFEMRRIACNPPHFLFALCSRVCTRAPRKERCISRRRRCARWGGGRVGRGRRQLRLPTLPQVWWEHWLSTI